MKAKYGDKSVMSTLNICCLDPRFMLTYFDDDELMAISHSVIQQGTVIARPMEEQQPPRPLEGGKNERQEESTYVSAAPTKKRRLVDILSTTNSPQEAMSIEEHVKEELSCYINLKSILVLLNGGNTTIKIFFAFP